MRIENQAAFVLHSRPYRESSLIVDLLSLDYGRVGVVAKGVRGNSKIARQHRGILQPFIPLQLSWQGRGELKNLIQMEALERGYALTGHNLYSAFYANELLMRLLGKADGQDSVYSLYVGLLQQLQHTDSVEVVLRQFELQLLAQLGYGIDLEREGGSGEPVLAGASYRYVVEFGFQRCQLAEAGAYGGAELLAIAANDFADASVRRAAKHLCRQLLKPHIGERPLKSRELFL